MGLLRKSIWRLDGLREIRKGIYSLDDYDPEQENPLVLVHPYCLFHGDPCCVENTRKFLREYEGPIITIEYLNRLRTTAKPIKDIGITKGRYFIAGIPDPVEISWDEAVEFITSFEGRPIKMAGGYRTLCLKAAADKIADKEEIEYIDEYVYT